MLETIKSYITSSSDVTFEEYYQQYIFDVQDQNIDKEIGAVRPNDILALDKLIAKLHKELLGN